MGGDENYNQNSNRYLFDQQPAGNDEQVVPMHGKNKVIDFSQVDDSTYDMLGGVNKNIQENNDGQEDPADDPMDESMLKVQNIP